MLSTIQPTRSTDAKEDENESGSAAKAAPAAENTKPNLEKEPTTDDIRQRAYEIYVARAGADGDEVQDWLQAENELRSKSA